VLPLDQKLGFGSAPGEGVAPLGVLDGTAAPIATVPPKEASRLTAVTVLGLLAALSLGVSLMLMLEFQRLGLFYLNDVLFDADVRTRLAAFAKGERLLSVLPFGLLSTLHPFLSLYVAPVVGGVAKVLLWLGLGEMSELQLRVALAAIVAPVVAALQCVSFGALLFELGLLMRHVVLIVFLSIFAFSNLIYGAIPEHFVISNLSITLMLLMAVASHRIASLDRIWIWGLLGLFSAGITITNAAFLGIVHLACGVFSRKESLFTAFSKSAILTLSVFTLVLVAEQVKVHVDNEQAHPAAADGEFIERFMRGNEPVLSRLERMLATVGNAIAPAPSAIRELEPPRLPAVLDPSMPAPFGGRSPYPKFTLDAAPGSADLGGVLGMLGLAGMMVGAVLMIRRGGSHRLAASASIGIVAFNLALHAFWGTEFFLYSQHWIAASIVLFSGIFFVPAKLQRAMTVGVTLFALAVAANNALVLWHLIAVARAAAAAG
jgi:hypothetical protein